MKIFDFLGGIALKGQGLAPPPTRPSGFFSDDVQDVKGNLMPTADIFVVILLKLAL